MCVSPVTTKTPKALPTPAWPWWLAYQQTPTQTQNSNAWPLNNKHTLCRMKCVVYSFVVDALIVVFFFCCINTKIKSLAWHEKLYFLLGVAWLESGTHDWLAEPRESHEHGMQGLSSSALTWPGKKGCYIAVRISLGQKEKTRWSLPQQVCRTQVCTSHSWFQLCNRGSPHTLHPLSSDRGCQSWVIDLLPSGWSDTPPLCRDSYTLKTQKHI